MPVAAVKRCLAELPELDPEHPVTFDSRGLLDIHAAPLPEDEPSRA